MHSSRKSRLLYLVTRCFERFLLTRCYAIGREAVSFKTIYHKTNRKAKERGKRVSERAGDTRTKSRASSQARQGEKDR